MSDVLNVMWGSGQREIAFGANALGLLQQLDPKQKLEKQKARIVTKLATGKVQFQIADLANYNRNERAGLRYEFIYQAKSGRSPGPTPAPSSTVAPNLRTTFQDPASMISTCIKDVATIDPNLVFLDENGNSVIYITLESSQMIRWILAGTTPATPQGAT